MQPSDRASSALHSVTWLWGLAVHAGHGRSGSRFALRSRQPAVHPDGPGGKLATFPPSKGRSPERPPSIGRSLHHPAVDFPIRRNRAVNRFCGKILQGCDLGARKSRTSCKACRFLLLRRRCGQLSFFSGFSWLSAISGDHPPPSALYSWTTDTRCNRREPVMANSASKRLRRATSTSR